GHRAERLCTEVHRQSCEGKKEARAGRHSHVSSKGSAVLHRCPSRPEARLGGRHRRRRAISTGTQGTGKTPWTECPLRRICTRRYARRVVCKLEDFCIPVFAGEFPYSLAGGDGGRVCDHYNKLRRVRRGGGRCWHCDFTGAL